MTERFIAQISTQLSKHLGHEETILNYSPVYGGSINSSYKLSSQNNDYFLKVNKTVNYPAMFKAEKKALELLSSKSKFYIPKTFFASEMDNDSFLLMEFVESSFRKDFFWEDFGIKLAQLHQLNSERFGLEYDNYIGSLVQVNSQHSTWADFFVENRLMIQEKIARNSDLIDSSISKRFNKLYNKMPDLFPVEKPSLVHGDLWSGNYMVNSEGEAVIMDPAIYYGHREMDLGMTQLFGGFDSKMYSSYNAEYALEKGWEQRLQLCNLYPLMVHLNLFGLGYLPQIKRILSLYV